MGGAATGPVAPPGPTGGTASGVCRAPVATMAVAAPGWRGTLLKALKKNARLANARYAQLATVRPDGAPANRTVVYRGFDGDSDRLTFVTDARSSKIEDLAHEPRVELCW